MFHTQIRSLIDRCRDAERAGVGLNEMLVTVVPEAGREMLDSPKIFLDWIQEDAEYSYFYFDALATGVCAKPREAVAMILELIVRESLDGE